MAAPHGILDNAAYDHRLVTVSDGVKLHVVTRGESGRLILFLHGFPEFWGAWHNQLVEYGVRGRVAAIDLRGYNLSEKPREVGAYALPRIVADIREVLNALSPQEPAVVVGHDWGGIAAWTLARESPHVVERLVIINAPHPKIFARELRTNWRQRLASSYAGYFQLPGLAEWTLSAFRYAALRKMVFGISSRPERFSRELRAEYVAAWRQPGAISSGLKYYRNSTNIRTLLDRQARWSIAVPTLVLWGDRDPSLLPSNLDGLSALVPQLIVKRHATATHWIVHEEPEWVNREIHAFVSR